MKENERVHIVRRLCELVERFRACPPEDGFGEAYKWELLERAQGQDALGIVQCLRGQNIVYNALVDPALKALAEMNPSGLAACVDGLRDEAVPLPERLARFKDGMHALAPDDWRYHANDERTAAAILFCRWPERYAPYKDEIYRLACRYFGFGPRKAGQKLVHFLEILHFFADLCGEAVQEILLPQTAHFRLRPTLLAVQTMLWCMKEKMSSAFCHAFAHCWAVGFTFGDGDSQLDRFRREGVWEAYFDTENATDRSTLALARQMAVGDAILLKSSFTRGSGHDISVLRVGAVGVVEGEVACTMDGKWAKCRCRVQYVPTPVRDFEGKPYGAYRKTVQLADNKIWDVIQYADECLKPYTMRQKMYQKGIEMLRACRNLVLTGAPGTGKTHMARAIAREMGAETEFVQFHPSYDYTDFVEGLRPVSGKDGQVGFERQDGVFKAFCKRAFENQTASAEASQGEKCEQKPFVFIIDEINRGEASKIFGELFYAIDPGYRGKSAPGERVRTQYWNLVPEDDVFHPGFFVPENVYILATMNDIDRSVECMDFAMRRRFTWMEVLPEQTAGMLDTLPCAGEAKARMQCLNRAICETEGLGEAYQLGAAYFLHLGENGTDFQKLWDMNIRPLLREYIRGFREEETLLDSFRDAFFQGEGEPADE